MGISRILPNVCSDRLPAARDFYVDLLGFEVAFDSDWFVQLIAPGDPSVGIGVLARDHDLVPQAHRQSPRGVILTIVVQDADEVHRRAEELGVEVVQPPHDTDYGQRRLLVLDPDGTLVDISAPTAPVAETFRQ